MISKSRFLAALLAVFLTGTALQAHAAELKIGFIDISVLYQRSPQAIAAQTEMAKKFEPRKKDLTAKQDKIKNKQDEITKNGVTMSPAQLQQAQNDLDEMQREMGRESSEYQDDVNAERNAQLSKLQQEVLKATQEFAQAAKFNMIVADGVVYHDSTVDVTDQVLAQMEKDFKAESSKSGD